MKTFCRALTLIVLLCLDNMALAETYPERPVRIVVPTPPGGGGDVLARFVAQKLSENLGRPFFVENIPGAGHNIGMGTVARAKPDGHTILFGFSPFMVNPLIYAKVPYDPIKDFAPISLLAVNHFVLVVHPSVPAKNGGELIALIKANPD